MTYDKRSLKTQENFDQERIIIHRYVFYKAEIIAT